MLRRLMSLPSPSDHPPPFHLITPPTEYSLVAPGINVTMPPPDYLRRAEAMAEKMLFPIIDPIVMPTCAV